VNHPERPNEAAATENFEFGPLDKAVNYRAALIREFAPFLLGRVLEVGAGIGQFTAALTRLPDVTEVVSIEPDPRFCTTFRQNHPELRLLQGTMEALGDDEEWNAAVCINVLEHIREDDAELAHFHRRLKRRSGHLCLFVPARMEIYAPLDKDFGHHRRYALPQLRGQLEKAGYKIVRLHYFNWVGYFAWWLGFCVLKRRRFDAKSVVLFDRVIFPVVHSLESHIARPPFGQSLLAVAQAKA
jgi:SAM-dependent methyltransferase